MIRLHFSNMMEETIGSNGITERQVEAVRQKIKDAHNQITGRRWRELAFLDLPGQDVTDIKNLADEIRTGFDNFLILGIGGSALGPRAVLDSLSPFHNLVRHPRIFIYDNVDPRTLDGILSVIELKKTAIAVITKSGSTAETAASFMILWDKMKTEVGGNAAKHFIAITDPEQGNLRAIANAYHIKSLPILPGIVGRYSVLSPVGLLLAEVAGIDSKRLLSGAGDIRERCLDGEVWKNPAYLFAVLVYLMQTEERRDITVMIPYADGLKSFSEWFCQIWAESLGKVGTGLTPYPSVGTTDQHSQLQLWMEGPDNKVIVFVKLEDYGVDYSIPCVFEDVEGIGYLGGHNLEELIKAEEESSELALTRASKPNMTISLPRADAYYLGQLFQFFEISTAFTGFLYGINPFNQPGVEEGKNLTYGMMGKKGFDQKKQEVLKAREKKICWTL